MPVCTHGWHWDHCDELGLSLAPLSQVWKRCLPTSKPKRIPLEEIAAAFVKEHRGSSIIQRYWHRGSRKFSDLPCVLSLPRRLERPFALTVIIDVLATKPGTRLLSVCILFLLLAAVSKMAGLLNHSSQAFTPRFGHRGVHPLTTPFPGPG